jgi:diaminobutyrate-2-oxoglutarate transaminase
VNIFEEMESEVRSYCRGWPAVFDRAEGSHLYDRDGTAYLDFFAGAGALNYGHNPGPLKEALLDYLASDGITHSLDLHTTAKRAFLERFEDLVLRPRGIAYRVMFPGPTGTNAVEAALKLARNVTGRTNVVCFTNGFHGMTLGSLAMTGNAKKRLGAGVPLSDATTIPFDGYLGDGTDTLDLFESMLTDGSSGLDKPAAVILETVQAEGGVNVASIDWLERLASICRAHDVLTVVDDIQVGCGRTGPFFSFDRAGLRPDIVTLSKSLSGYGTPMSIVLIRPDLDHWKPGEHNGTFRGHNLAFVTATAALESYWRDGALRRDVERRGAIAAAAFQGAVRRHPELLVDDRGLGLIRGLVFADPRHASAVSRMAFTRGLIIETAGPNDEVLKLLPPLTIDDEALERGLSIIDKCLEAIAERRRPSRLPEELHA